MSTWFYPPRQYDVGMLHTLVREGFASNRHVHYPGNFASTAPRADFRIDGRVVTVQAPGDEPPVLRHDTPGVVVETRLPGETGWSPAVRVEGWGDAPPHLDLEPTVDIAARHVDGLWITPTPVLGRPVFTSGSAPVILSGESREEALADPDEAETRHDLRRLPGGRWTTEHALGFQFLRIDAPDVTEVTVRAYRRPTPRRGGFACSDETLNRIWDASATTLHACMHGLMLDGIKRDRMPWIGDQALNTLANAYAFGDPAIVTATFTALGRPAQGYVNGIADYSLWWLIGTGFLSRHFDAAEHLAGEADHLHEFTERLAALADGDGLLHPVPTDADFGFLVFIDWGVQVDEGRDPTALQVLWYWALTSAGTILESVNHPGAPRWFALAETVRHTLEQRAWDAAAGTWREYVDGESPASPYPNFLAVLAGLSSAGDAGVGALLASTPRAGTPFMTGFLIRALIDLGRTDEAVDRIRTLWGGMLDAGATTFWEEFAEPGRSPYAMYGRPFGKSLCHAWSTGPAALLPEAILGVRSLADGWRRFSVQPRLGDLTWAEARVPAPTGDIVVSVRDGVVDVRVPAGTTLVRDGDDHVGPASATWRLA